MALADDLLAQHGRNQAYWLQFLVRCGVPPASDAAGLSLRQRQALGQALRQLEPLAPHGLQAVDKPENLSRWARQSVWQWLRVRRPWLLPGGVSAAQAERRRAEDQGDEAVLRGVPLPEGDPRLQMLRNRLPGLDLSNLAVCALLEVAASEARLAAVLRRVWPGLPPQSWPLQGMRQIAAPQVREFAPLPSGYVVEFRSTALVRLRGPQAPTAGQATPGGLATSRGLLTHLPLMPNDRIPLVFSPELRAALHELTLRWQHRRVAALGSGGLVALLAGPEGHGRRTAAREIAESLGMSLLKVQPALLGSRWIGESEQRISQMFRQAAQGGCGLLIDDAQDLLSGRVAVQSAGDRYANTASNHLLQEIEQFTGLVLLVAHGPHQFDAAMRRRIQVVVRFEPPDLPLRRAIVVQVLAWLARRDRQLRVDADLEVQELALAELTPAQLVRGVLGAAMAARQQEIAMQFELLQHHLLGEVRQAAGLVRRRVDLADADR
jgi:hypothetical protein